MVVQWVGKSFVMEVTRVDYGLSVAQGDGTCSCPAYSVKCFGDAGDVTYGDAGFRCSGDEDN